MRLPVEYRAIDGAAQITRGDLAALIGVRLAGLLGSTRARTRCSSPTFAPTGRRPGS
jgi:hypothetical protein